MKAALQPRPARRFLAVGHVTIDEMPDGVRRPGGTVLYSALQAARLGLSATILTRGDVAQIESMLAPFAGEIELLVQPAAATTRLATEWSGLERRQRVMTWAGPIDRTALPAAEVLHLAPVAAELPDEAIGPWEFVGLTPQGLTRRWQRLGDRIASGEADPGAVELAGRCDAIVLSEQERDDCRALIDAGLRGGATVAITAGPGSTEVIVAHGAEVHDLPAKPIVEPAEDLGAGDVYAATFFVLLAAGEEPLLAARTAHVAAALRIRGVGPDAIADAATIAAELAKAAP